MNMNSYPGPRPFEQDDLLFGCDDQAESAFDRRLPVNPYPGLRPFEQDDLLLGRDGPVDELIRMLKAERFVAVTGVSGSGKSSLIRAGLIPALIRGLLPIDQNEWRVVVMTPGNGPIGSLRAVLGKVGIVVEPTAQSTHESGDISLESGGTSLIKAVEAASKRKETASFALFLLVDQFEDLFRYARETSKDEANAFIELLREAIQQRETPIYIVLTMRSDFLGDAARFRGLPELINRSNYLIPRMTRGELTEAITRPAESQGVRLSAKLVDRLLNDIRDDPSRLPLLQHVLNRTWERWVEGGPSTGVIEISHYRKAGTIDGEDGQPGALHVHAQEIYEKKLSDVQRSIAEALFSCITERSQQGRDCRRPCSIETVTRIAFAPRDAAADWKPHDDQRACLREVVEIFRNSSFLRAPEDGLPGEVVDLSHESLISGWGTLQSWIESEARRVKDWVWLADMERRHREESGPFLRRGQIRWATELINKPRFNCFWIELISSSVRADKALKRMLTFVSKSEEEERKERNRDAEGKRRRREAERAQRRIRRALFKVIVVAALLLALAAAWTTVEFLRARKALEERNRLYNEKQTLLDEALKRVKDAQDRSQRALDYAEFKLRSGGTRERVLALRALARALRFDPANRQAILKVCDLLTKSDWCPPLTRGLYLPRGRAGLLAPAFSPDKRIVVVCRDGNLYEADERTGTLTVTQSLLPTASVARKGQVPNIDPRYIVEAPPKRQEVSAGDLPPLLNPPLLNAKFSDDGNWLLVFHMPASTQELPTCEVWKWEGRSYIEQGSILQLKDRALFRNVAWNNDGKMCVLTRYDEPTCQVFQYDGRNYDRTSDVLGEMANEKIVAAGFSPDGQLLATATFSETLDKRATVQLRNAATLTLLQKDSGFKAQIPVPIEVKPTQLCFGPGEDELTIVAWGSGASIVVNLRSGKYRPVSFGSSGATDAVMRLAFALPEGSNQQDPKSGQLFIAAVLANRVEVFEHNQPEHRAFEAICPAGATVFPAFAPEGDRLLTLSGSSLVAMDTLRVWDLRRREPAAIDPSAVNGDEVAPPWLADLAAVVGGQGGDSEGEDIVVDTSGSQIRSLAELATTYPDEKIRGKYEAIWWRYFPKSAR